MAGIDLWVSKETKRELRSQTQTIAGHEWGAYVSLTIGEDDVTFYGRPTTLQELGVLILDEANRLRDIEHAELHEANTDADGNCSAPDCLICELHRARTEHDAEEPPSKLPGMYVEERAGRFVVVQYDKAGFSYSWSSFDHEHEARRSAVKRADAFQVAYFGTPASS